MHTDDQCADALLPALQQGPLTRWDLPMMGKCRMGMDELRRGINRLNQRGIRCGRIDSGGSPTWALAGQYPD